MISRTALAELREVLARHGNQVRLAEQLGMTRQAIHRWLERGVVPAARCEDVERITGVHRSRLNPEAYPPAPIGRLSTNKN